MKIRSSVGWIGVLPLLMGTTFAAEAPDSEQVTKLLSEAKTQAFQLKEDAATMESFNRMAVTRETQAAAINQIRDHINALGRTEAKLQESQVGAPAWQKQVIGRIAPFLDELDGYTSAVMEHLTGEVPHTFAEYKDYLEANADYSADLAKMIGDFVDYGKTKDRFERLANKLEISSR
jgi:hypothetical protein